MWLVKIPKETQIQHEPCFLVSIQLFRNDSSRMSEARGKERMEIVLIIKVRDKNCGIGKCPLCQEQASLIYLFLTVRYIRLHKL